MKPPDSDNKRRHPRFPLQLHVEYQRGTDYVFEWTENLSEGGFFIRTEQAFPQGSALELTLSFPGLLEPVNVEGRVAWIRAPSLSQCGGVGVEVDNEGGRRRLADLALRAADRERGKTCSFSVLIVEDNERIVRSYERVLNHIAQTTEGQVKIHFAPKAHSALNQLKNHAVDLVITDIYMPIMDGLTLIENIRKQDFTRNLPVIVVTSGTGDERERAAKLGVRAFLRKPVQFSHILQTIVALATANAV